jgi:hypothetical protein
MGGRIDMQSDSIKITARVLVVPLEEAADPFWARADSIARRGLFVRTTHVLPLDAACLLKVVTGDESEALWARCTVVHHIPGAGFGCQYVQLAPEMKERLELWLAPPLVRRPRPTTEQVAH